MLVPRAKCTKGQKPSITDTITLCHWLMHASPFVDFIEDIHRDYFLFAILRSPLDGHHSLGRMKQLVKHNFQITVHPKHDFGPISLPRREMLSRPR